MRYKVFRETNGYKMFTFMALSYICVQGTVKKSKDISVLEKCLDVA